MFKFIVYLVSIYNHLCFIGTSDCLDMKASLTLIVPAELGIYSQFNMILMYLGIISAIASYYVRTI